MLLDEPFSALDAPLRARLRIEMLGLQHELDAMTILVTHDPEEAALLADELLLLEEGRVLQCGPTADVWRRPANEMAARLLGADNVAEGVAADRDHIALGDGVSLTVAGPALRPGERVGWSVPPRRIRLNPEGSYRGSIEKLIPMGVGRQITVRIGDTRIRVWDEQSSSFSHGLCRFDIDPYSVQVWPRN